MAHKHTSSADGRMSVRSEVDLDPYAQLALAREPGEYSWKRASRRLSVSLGGIALLLVLIGFAVARGGPAALVILLLAAVAMLVLYRESERGRLNAVPDLKGYRGERMVADLLGMLEPLGFQVVHGLEYVDTHGNTKNIDHTVIGATGVFAVETKNWNGRMWKAEGNRLIHNGVDETRSVLQSLDQAKELRRRLNSAQVSVRWVSAVLVSAKSTLPDVRVEFKYVTLIGASDLVPFIRDRPSILFGEEVAAAISAVSRATP